MENEFLVGSNDSNFSEGDFFIVSASTVDEAMEVFIKNIGIKDDSFLEYVSERSINSSFATCCFNMTEEEYENDFKNCFKRGIKQFFGDHSDYAEFYTKEYFDGDDEYNMDTQSFPEGMLIYMFKNSNWSPATVFKISEIRKLN